MTAVRLAGISGALAIGLGAYGAHVLRERADLEPRRKVAFDAASKYHLAHSLALLASPLCGRPFLTSSLLVTGMTVFCGCCYHYSLTGKENLRRFTPYGGVILICAWLSMVF